MTKGGIHGLLNAIVLLMCGLLVGALVLPSIQRHRAQARASACAANLRMLGLAFHNYHSAYKLFPAGSGGTDAGDVPENSNQGRLGPLVGLLPFMEQQALWAKISNPWVDVDSGKRFPSMGPVPWYDAQVYRPWSQSPATYTCPDRPTDRDMTTPPKIVYSLQGSPGAGVMTSYVVCYGDGTLNVGTKTDRSDPQSYREAMATKRGMFVSGFAIRMRDTLDGTSYTALMSETRSLVDGKSGLTGIAKGVAGIALNPSLCLDAAETPDTKWWDFGRGSRWCDGALPISGFQTVLPPNSTSCTSDGGLLDAIASASSYHPGGVYLLFADGRVAFATDTIDTGNLQAPGVALDPNYTRPGSPSPYGVWGAIGTRAGAEAIGNRNRDFPAGVEAVTVPSVRPQGTLRMWQDRDGRISLTAKFVRIIDQQSIELEDASGTLHLVPLNTLRDQDIYRAVVEDLNQQQ